MFIELLLAAYLSSIALRATLEWLNLRERRRHSVRPPDELADCIDTATLERSIAYSDDRARFGLVRLAFHALVVIAFIFGGGLRLADEWLRSAMAPGILQGVCLFVGVHLVAAWLELPFDFIETFRIEARHGFNRMSHGRFFGDWLKGLVLGLVLYTGASAGGLWLMRLVPDWYWLWVWVAAIVLAVVLMLIAPKVIEPLFIKTSPLSNRDLADQVRQLAARVGVRVNHVLEVDASQRTAHSNAYFTGIGRVKRVVLFDTLLKQLTEPEVLAVLGHELGHWKLKHVSKRLLTTAVFALAVCFGFAYCLARPELAAWIAIPQASVAAKIVVLGFTGSVLGFFMTPLSSAWSRQHEWEADAFAVELTAMPRELAAALGKLARDNLSDLHPHPLYVKFYYSHPPMPERVRKLTAQAAALGAH
jgi:STE24 endopeptidase